MAESSSDPTRASEQPDIFRIGSDPPDEVIEHRSLRERRGGVRTGMSLNLTAMIDVTFLLLVYFMIATEFKVGEEGYRLDLPRSLQSTQVDDPFDLDDQPLVINIMSSGPVNLQYEIKIDGPYQSPDTFNELLDFLRDRQINDRGAASRPMFFPDHPIIIRPARTATWDHAIDAFNAAARAEYTNIKFGKPL